MGRGDLVIQLERIVLPTTATKPLIVGLAPCVMVSWMVLESGENSVRTVFEARSCRSTINQSGGLPSMGLLVQNAFMHDRLLRSACCISGWRLLVDFAIVQHICETTNQMNQR